MYAWRAERHAEYFGGTKHAALASGEITETERDSHPWCGLIHKPFREQPLECQLSLDPCLALSWNVPFGTTQNTAVE